MSLLSLSEVPASLARLLPVNLALEFEVLVVASTDEEITLAVAKPLSASAIARLERASGRQIRTRIVAAHLLAPELTRCYGGAPSYQEGEESTTILMLDALLNRAILERASDVHLIARENELAVRMRIDGSLKDFEKIEAPSALRIFSRVKLISGMDIAERRLPQDGRIRFAFQGRMIDIRVASLPTETGERLALRLFDTETATLSLAELGMSGLIVEQMQRMLQSASGLLLICGPTGSGKTTTLYSALEHIDRGARHICTVEDPVERRIRGLSQVSVNLKSGLSFSVALRALLRQDPDVIMIGEIRDEETAQTAVDAALTGQLVLASVHSPHAFGAIERMRELGVRPGSLAAVLSGILAQRLVRRLCPMCRQRGSVGFSAYGCGSCQETGYRGRLALFDLVLDNEAQRSAYFSGANAPVDSPSRQALLQMVQHSIEDGITTRAEIQRISSFLRGDVTCI